jgi:regulatory protein
LVGKGYDAVVVAEVVEDLRDERLINDVRFGESLVRMLTNRGQGPRRVRQALAEAGMDEEAIAAALGTAPDWKQLAADIRRRKFGASLPNDWPGRARQMRFLQYRGFSTDQIASALGGPLDGEE